MKSEGLGDDIEKVFKATGVKALVDKTSELLGIKDCGCTRRKEWVNSVIPYNSPQSINLDLESFKSIEIEEGIYLVNNNIIVTKNGEIINYKIGEKILIKLDDPSINTFRHYLNMGVITKYESWNTSNPKNNRLL